MDDSIITNAVLGAEGSSYMKVYFNDNVLRISDQKHPLSGVILDIRGAVVAPFTGTSVDLSGIPSGVYILSVTDQQTQIVSRFCKH